MLRFQCLLGWLIILAISPGLQVGNLQSGDALVTCDPGRLEIGPKQTRTMRILISNARAVYGIDLQAGFDPAVVEVVDADSAREGVQMTAGTFLKPDFTILNLADNQAGTLRFVVTQLNPTPPADGKGTLLSIQFRSKISGRSSRLSFVTVTIADRNGARQPVTTRAADLILLSPTDPTSTALPGVVGVAGEPTWSAPTLTPASAQPAIPDIVIGTRKSPLVRTSATQTRYAPEWILEADQAPSDQVSIYGSVVGISGVIVLLGLPIWIVSAKLRRKRAAKAK